MRFINWGNQHVMSLLLPIRAKSKKEGKNNNNNNHFPIPAQLRFCKNLDIPFRIMSSFIQFVLLQDHLSKTNPILFYKSLHCFKSTPSLKRCRWSGTQTRKWTWGPGSMGTRQIPNSCLYSTIDGIKKAIGLIWSLCLRSNQPYAVFLLVQLASFQSWAKTLFIDPFGQGRIFFIVLWHNAMTPFLFVIDKIIVLYIPLCGSFSQPLPSPFEPIIYLWKGQACFCHDGFFLFFCCVLVFYEKVVKTVGARPGTSFRTIAEWKS